MDRFDLDGYGCDDSMFEYTRGDRPATISAEKVFDPMLKLRLVIQGFHNFFKVIGSNERKYVDDIFTHNLGVPVGSIVEITRERMGEALVTRGFLSSNVVVRAGNVVALPVDKRVFMALPKDRRQNSGAISLAEVSRSDIEKDPYARVRDVKHKPVFEGLSVERAEEIFVGWHDYNNAVCSGGPFRTGDDDAKIEMLLTQAVEILKLNEEIFERALSVILGKKLNYDDCNFKDD